MAEASAAAAAEAQAAEATETTEAAMEQASPDRCGIPTGIEGKRRVVTAETAAAAETEAKAEETEEERPRRKAAATKMDEPTGELMAQKFLAIIEEATTMGKAVTTTADKMVLPSPPRPGVLRPGAAKRAHAAPRVTAYAAAMVKARVHEIFDEIMASGVESANAAAAAAIEQAAGELPTGRGGSEQGGQ